MRCNRHFTFHAGFQWGLDRLKRLKVRWNRKNAAIQNRPNRSGVEKAGFDWHRNVDVGEGVVGDGVQMGWVSQAA